MSNNQLFIKNVKNELLFELLDKICQVKENYYYLDQNAFRKMLFHGYDKDFCSAIKEHYYLSKQFYVTRTMTYKSFTNIVRQICKHNNVMFNSSIRYSDSKYSIEFFIYF
jgi:tRNA G18 (ribose-2'-O)-methylase SpoU